MTCPKCEADTRVIDSRPHLGRYIKRRRRCLSCGHRFTTWEKPE